MKFHVDASVLKRLCRVFHSGTHPISFNAYLGDHNYVSASGYDGFKYMHATFNADVYDGGEVIIPARYLSVIPYLEDRVLMHYLTSDKLSLRDPARQFLIPSEKPDRPYLMPERMTLGSITVELKELKTLIKRVRFATGIDDRLGFDCVLLQFGDHIKAVGCDRRTVAVARMQQGSPYCGKFHLPKRALEVITDLDGDMVSLTFHPNGVGLSVVGEIMVDIYMPERVGHFPSYEALLDVPVNTTLQCRQDDLASILADMRLVSDKVNIKCGHEGYVKLFARFRARDESDAAVERYLKGGNWDGADLKVNVKGRVVEQAIEHIAGVVTFRFSNDMGPFSITSEDESFVAVLMPYSGAEKK